MIYNSFNGVTAYDYAAFDTETHTYVDGEILPEDRIREMCAEMDGDEPKYPEAWWREHTEVRAWAYLIYTPDGFAVCQTLDEFLFEIKERNIKTGWWYNAPFDMSVLDAGLLRTGYRYVQDHPSPGEYCELVSDFGARYSVTLNIPNGKTRGHKLMMYDLRNILHGGLEDLLKSYDVRDEKGNPIRKLEMSYQTADGSTEADIAYMRNDVAGLWWLVKTASDVLYSTYSYRIDGKKPEVLTASGLSKKYVLKRMYPRLGERSRLLRFQAEHPMTIEQDRYYRQHGLLGGGLCCINPKYRGRCLIGIQAYRNDANAHYPAYMSDMLSVFGHPEAFPDVDTAMNFFNPHTDCFILRLTALYGEVKPNRVPIWRNPFTAKIEDCIMFEEGPLPEMCMFLEELTELCHWYDFTRIDVAGVICYHCRKEPAIEAVMREETERKTAAKKAKDWARYNTHKLVPNGFGGKYSQNPMKAEFDRAVFPDGVVRRFEVEGTERADPRMIMHVVQGARITANGRVRIRQAIRRAYEDDVPELFLYTDTDSFHGLRQNPYNDPYTLGAFKQENDTPICEACFLAPKTYYEIEESGEVSIHSKGVNVEAIYRLYKAGEPLRDIYIPGRRIQSLHALNVVGGKALIPLPKFLCKTIAGDEALM